jgi:hypothetical protein
VYALCIEIDVTTLDADATRRVPDDVMAGTSATGSTGTLWVSLGEDAAVGVLLFDTEDDARAAAGHLVVGQQVAAPTSGATVRSVRVGEVVDRR